MLELDVSTSNYLKACMDTVEKGECQEVVHYGIKLVLSLLHDRRIELGHLKSTSDQKTSQQSYQTLKSLTLLNDSFVKKLPKDFDYTSLLYGYISVFYPYFYVERARELGEKPSLSSLKISTFEYTGQLDADEIELHFSFADHRISSDVIKVYRMCSYTLDHSHLTLYESEDLLLKHLQQALDDVHLSGLTVDDRVTREHSTQSFSLKVVGRDGLQAVVKQLVDAGVNVSMSAPHFAEFAASFLGVDKKATEHAKAANRHLFFGSQTVEFNRYDDVKEGKRDTKSYSFER